MADILPCMYRSLLVAVLSTCLLAVTITWRLSWAGEVRPGQAVWVIWIAMLLLSTAVTTVSVHQYFLIKRGMYRPPDRRH